MISVFAHVVGVTVGFYLCCCVGISLNVLESYHRMCVCCTRRFILSVALQRPVYIKYIATAIGLFFVVLCIVFLLWRCLSRMTNFYLKDAFLLTSATKRHTRIKIINYLCLINGYNTI